MALGTQQEPLNRARIWRIGLRDDLADHLGTIGQLPAWTGKVSTDLPALLIEEIGLPCRE
jgi:hypothetical protein